MLTTGSRILLALIFLVGGSQLSYGRQADTVSITVHETIQVSDESIEVLPPVEIKINEDVSVDDGQSRLPPYLFDPAVDFPMRSREDEIRFLREWFYSSA